MDHSLAHKRCRTNIRPFHFGIYCQSNHNIQMRIARVGVPLLVLIGVVVCSGTSTKADSVTFTLGKVLSG
jgi:hypothetical protein